MARSARIDKTNALRELDSAGIAYTVETYEADDGMPGRDYGVHVAELLGHDPESSFQTRVTVTPSAAYPPPPSSTSRRRLRRRGRRASR